MCGIFGYLHYGSSPMLNLHILAKELGWASTERGTHATGVAYVDVKGNLSINKKDVSAFNFNFDSVRGASVVMGHTRHATQGPAKFYYNNHPFQGYLADKSKFAFAHNGILDNDYSLRRDENLPKTKILTDSYVMCQLMEKEGSLSMEALTRATEKVQGIYVFTFLDQENKLYFVKGSNPLTIFHFKSLKLYVYASTEDIIFESMAQFGPTRKILADAFVKGNMTDVEVIQPDDGTILSISINGEIANGTFNIDNDYLAYRWSKKWMVEDWADTSRGGNWEYPKQSNHGYSSTYLSRTSQSWNPAARKTELEALYEYAQLQTVSKEEIDDLMKRGGFTVDQLEKELTNGKIWQLIEMLYAGDFEDDYKDEDDTENSGNIEAERNAIQG